MDQKEWKQAQEQLLNSALHGKLGMEDRVAGDHLELPAWKATLTPEFSRMDERGVVVDFRLEAPEWGSPMTERCAGTGADLDARLNMAVQTFLHPFLSGVARMENMGDAMLLSTTFAGKPHRWKAYLSDIAALGGAPRVEQDLYWQELKEDLLQRLGNQKLCQVKVYAAKVNGQATGECRIDDVKSDELSAKVARLAEGWAGEFGSHKQFFFLRQATDTILINPYMGKDGRKLLMDKVVQAVKLFHGCKTEADWDSLEERMISALGDVNLATECFAFLPEICAENAYANQMTFPETVYLQVGDRPRQTVYKNQMADYWPIRNVLFEAFQNGVFGLETDAIYKELVNHSASAKVIAQIRQKEGTLNGGKVPALLFQMDEGFVLR